MKDIRFVLYSHDDAFENEIRRRLAPYCNDIIGVEEHGDAGTTITIICEVLQTLLAIPACVLAIQQIIEWKNKHDKSKESENEKENKPCPEDAILGDQPREKITSQPWTMIVDGHIFDFSGLPSDYERIQAFNKACESFPSIFGNSSEKCEEQK